MYLLLPIMLHSLLPKTLHHSCHFCCTHNYQKLCILNYRLQLPMKIVSSLIFSILPLQGGLILVMDRTNWRFGQCNINILMLGVSYRNVAIPLMFKMLDKRGNSNTTERIALIEDFMDWFGRDRIDCLLADREFVGDQWLEFLNRNQIRYHIRIRNNFKVFLPRK